MTTPPRPALSVGLALVLALAGCAPGGAASVEAGGAVTLADLERERVLSAADAYLDEPPVTVTAAVAERSAGGRHDFYSEGDYWWPNPDDPGGPYVRRDGLTNPDNFVAHRDAMRRLSVIVPALAAAYRLTGDDRYAAHARRHLDAWFVDESTRMTPNLLYAQAISGRVTGRGIGIIDTVHLVEVAQAVRVLEAEGGVDAEAARPVKAWFADYLDWMTTHEYGTDERDHGNNHSSAWALQAAAFARLVADEAVLADVRRRFKTVLLPDQMAADGSFPQEMERTKPYGYALFNLDMLGMVAEIASTPDDDLWTFALPDGRGMERALDYMAPYVADKSAWPLPPDVMYDDAWPVRHPALLFGGLALDEPAYVALWTTLEADPTEAEVVRNFPVRQPLLWEPPRLPLPATSQG
ncbi:alginate lyase family protein [Rubrivirga litoralis]|uniref:Alginate lyase family protein n=1 Tax=Rubrivirga litoralis TaxID=3075598 RepID=A0ABU3BNS9_9BACT|nr:alginate lyase family protein [Rubrivirga sp. F394]MDT0630918.1 alginate lyase family protein [Rubrivirga sp. F394]